jgi:hypothetical protein
MEMFCLVDDAAVIRPTFKRTDFEGWIERSLARRCGDFSFDKDGVEG